MSYPPQLKDRLGALHPSGTNRRAINASYATIPANETIVLLNWLRLASPPYTGDPAIGLFLFSDNPTVDFLYIEGNAAAGQLKFNAVLNAVTQSLTVGAHPGDHCFAQVLDRDNTQLEAWIDGVKHDSAALTSDPDFTTQVGAYLFGTGAGVVNYEQCAWKGIILSLANGSTPTQAQWSEILSYMRDPDAPLHPILTAAKGTVYSDYRCGEGLNGSAVLEDQGDTGDDLTWQGGETADDVRIRKQSPRRKPRRTFYSLTPGYTATTGNVDFGFDFATSDEFRALFDGMHDSDHVGVELTNAAGTHYFRVERVGGVPRIAIRAGGAVATMDLSEDQFRNGGDITIAAITTNAYICINGQFVGQMAMGGTMNLSGNCQVNLDGRSRCCLVEGYNQYLFPGDFCNYICCTTQQPERTLLNLGTPLASFPIRSDLIAAGGTTVVNQGSGGGTLTLSAQRSTSCEEVRHGFDP
jgi:hypothetical protein